MSNPSDNEPPGKLGWLSHPIANVIVGFFLTGVVGTLFTQHFFDRRQDEQLRAHHLQHRKEVIEFIAQRVAGFQMRAELLVNDIQNSASKYEIRKQKQAYDDAFSKYEVRRQKRAYDDAFIKWRTDNPAVLLLIKDLLNPAEYQRFRQSVISKLHTGAIAPVRECLQKAYASAAHPEQAAEILEACDIRGRLQIINRCANAIAEQLHELTAEVAGVGAKTNADRRTELEQQVERQCS